MVTSNVYMNSNQQFSIKDTPKYKQRADEPFLVELVMVRTWEFLNCGALPQSSGENCLVELIRIVAPAFRLAYFLTGVYLIILSQFVLTWPLVFRYSLFSSNSSMAPGNMTVNMCMVLWALDFVFLAAAYYFTRVGANSGVGCLSSTAGFAPLRCVTTPLYAVFFSLVAIVGIVSTHTVLGHMWQARNVWFAALLLLQCTMLVVSSLGDAIDAGSPLGTQKPPRIAGILLAIRLRVLVLPTVIFSVASVFSSWPPSHCAQC